ncbi:S1 family peptidase [Pseudobacteriovorax antillogorgiicola]|uniref:Trypsin n=1 Tax=Pseudobacteriovorax antillogorgiicola TaxID=1513793 RepID=A0A1Y6CMH9_9BACT|nr:trypsin-like serine protease [Pseudobacteriovorax antillogorgiicola]TCS46952.1 trypsin [Pseudobacteriovorax antillogorgiicola]SMF64517.1 Trypsin [Pseudobacteriovorax antillogorgiicola]
MKKLFVNCCVSIGLMSTLVSCGVKENSSLKISNGVPANLAPMGIQKSTVGISLGGGICSGTLIREDIVLTAAHCISNRMSVTVGESFGTGDAIPVQSAVIHPSWRGQNTRTIVPNDIAVVKLSRSAVPYGAVPMPLNPSESISRDVWIAGYGQRETGGSGRLLYADVTASSVNRTFAGTIETSRQGDRQGACPGDSGGPMYTRIDGNWYVTGALSGGSGCGAGNVYSSSIYFRDFIDEAIADLGTSYPAPNPGQQPEQPDTPDDEPEVNPRNPCGEGCEKISGYLANGQVGVLGDAFYGQGVIKGFLIGAEGTDFDLYLQRRGFFGWSTVASSEGESSNEAISVSTGNSVQALRWVIKSYSGAGQFTFFSN